MSRPTIYKNYLQERLDTIYDRKVEIWDHKTNDSSVIKSMNEELKNLEEEEEYITKKIILEVK